MYYRKNQRDDCTPVTFASLGDAENDIIDILWMAFKKDGSLQ